MNDFFYVIKNLLLLEGFVRVGWAEVCELPEKSQAYFDDWIESAKHGTMAFLERPEYADAYKNPTAKYPFAKSIIAAVFPYNIYGSPKKIFEINQKFKVSRYALNVDYHNLLKCKLQQIMNKLKLIYPDAMFEVQVDSGALPEIYWAEQAGVGLRRKNGLLYVPEYGSWIFIALIITSIKIEAQKPTIFHDDFCMHCNKCIEACPTSAISADYMVDPSKCISYLTIEHKGELSITTDLQDWIYGCDICQQVCPKNSKVFVTEDKNFTPAQFWQEISAEKLHNMSNSAFLRIFQESPIKRTGLKRLLRNINANVKNINHD